jgi:hypothetical protein
MSVLSVLCSLLCAQSAEAKATVAKWIVDTKTHTTADIDGDEDEAHFLDFDLSVLGEDEEQYDAYARHIRSEYAHYPDDAYRSGRHTHTSPPAPALYVCVRESVLTVSDRVGSSIAAGPKCWSASCWCRRSFARRRSRRRARPRHAATSAARSIASVAEMVKQSVAPSLR